MLIDNRIYSDTVVTKVVYCLSTQYSILRSRKDEYHEEILASSVSENENSDFEQLFTKMLNDYKMRELIDKETHDIKTILYAKAFAEDENFEI